MQKSTPLKFSESSEKNNENFVQQMDEKLKELSPKKQCVTNILNYSKALSIEKSNLVEHIEVILN